MALKTVFLTTYCVYRTHLIEEKKCNLEFILKIALFNRQISYFYITDNQL